MGIAEDARALVESWRQRIGELVEEQTRAPGPWSRFDPESPKIQREVEDWGAKTTFGILAGMLYGGIREGYASAHWQPLLPSQAGSRTWNERQQLWKNMWEQRMLRVAGGTVRGAAKLGTFTGMFCGVQKGMEIYRDKNDPLNTVGAACSTAAILGLAFPGSFKWRLRTSLLGALLGAVLGLPLGYVHSMVTQQQPEAGEAAEQSEPAVASSSPSPSP